MRNRKTLLLSLFNLTRWVAILFSASFAVNLGNSSAMAQTAPQTIQLTAVNPDGTNTGTARLGVPVALSTTVSAGPYMARGWTLQGAGTLQLSTGTIPTATYIPPQIMPSSASVTITVNLAWNPTVTTSYTFSLVNPIPAVSSIGPNGVPAGGTTPVTVTGTGFVPGTTILINNSPVSTTYQSPTSLTAQITVAAATTGNLSLQALNTAPGGGTSPAVQLPTWAIQVTAQNSDGTNTGTARLGVPVSLTSVIGPGTHTARAWTLQGAGTLVPSGTTNVGATYTPPQNMPANASVTIIASLGFLPGVQTAYTLTLVNPTPMLASISPAQLLAGGTQPLSIVGSGFVAGSVALVGGNPVPTTFTDVNHLSAQVPVAGNAHGTLTLQIQNPSPAGGVSAISQIPVDATSLTLTATGPDGSPTSTAVLGGSVPMSATVTGSLQNAVNWSVAGAGSISATGLYSAPTAMPSSNAVTITATLASNSTVTASYPLSLTNPIPVINTGSPAQAQAGATTPVTLSGTGFVPGTIVLVNGSAVPTTVLSGTSLLAQVGVAAGATGVVQIAAENPSPGGGTGPFFTEAVATALSVGAAARILDQTTFGPTTALIQHVQQEGVTAWLTEQFNTPQTVFANIPVNFPAYCGDAANCAMSEWWQAVLTGNDQLRQRVAFALSQLFVISSEEITGQALPPYANMLAADAFGNWYTLMNDVTLSPAMGIYLNMLNSYKQSGNLIANENFARENMQLFNMGLFLLNQDGSLQLDSNGNPQPAYNEAQVQAFSRAYTGWTYANADGSSPGDFTGTPNYIHPLVAVEKWHDTNPKTLLNLQDPTSFSNGTTVPAGQTAEQDMASALTNIFNHPNVPPFVSKQLIQHLVTSTPSPGYISRVAAVFADDGNHVRGNMSAVLMAIFTDPEARAGDADPTVNEGRLREPVLWLTAAMRGLGYVNTDPNNDYYWASTYTGTLSERPFASPNVFNFFPPTYVIPGTMLNAPEFALENTASITDRLNLADTVVKNEMYHFNVDLSASSPLGQVASDASALVDALGTVFMHGAMDTNTRSAIIGEISNLTDPAQRIRVAAYLTLTSSAYKIAQ